MQTQKANRPKAQTKSAKSTRRRRKEPAAEPVILESPPVASPPTVVSPPEPERPVPADAVNESAPHAQSQVFEPRPEASKLAAIQGQPTKLEFTRIDPVRVESTGEELLEPGHWLKLLGQWTEETVFKMLFHRRTP